MATILNIETATSICSVAIGIDGKCVALKESNEGRTHAEFITVFIDEVIKTAGIEYKDLDAIAVSSGPGSYTGLRIGVSTAKGLCYALSKPLIAVETLEALAWGACKRFEEIEKNISLMEPSVFDYGPDEILFCPMIDARRMEVYTCLYYTDLEIFKPVSSEIISRGSYFDILQEHKIIFFGDGMPKCRDFLWENNAHFFKDLLSSASNMISLSDWKFKKKEFEDLAYFEPFYLKEVNITKPKDSPTK